jgi:hypothetical protein
MFALAPAFLTPAGGAGGVPTYTFGNVKLLVHGSARPYIDVSNDKNMVANQFAQATVSGGRIQYPSTSTRLTVPTNNTSWQFGTGAWFISGNIKVNVNSVGGRVFDSRPSSGSSSGWAMSVQQTSRAPFIVIEGTTYGVGTPAANLLVTNDVATTVSFSYDGTDLRCFVDGALSWTHTVALNIDTGSNLIVGNTAGASPVDANTTQSLNELLIIKGEVVATATFSVPSSWTDTGIVLESWNPATYANVKLNVHMSGTNGGTTFTDTSASARTVTANGNAQTSTAQARIGSSSGLFDGTGDFLTVPDSADWDMSADFSWEAQIRTAAGTRQVLFSNYQDASNGITIQFSLTTAGRVFANVSGDGSEIDTGASYTPVATNTWVHVAVSRVSSNLYLFIEGECVFWVVDSTSTSSTKAWFIGRLTDVSTTIDFNGHMQEVRGIKGEGYPHNFLVQTAAHPDS